MVLSITLPSSDFTDRDFDSWLIELRARKNAAFPAWTDDNTPNYGNILLEMFAHTLDVLSFYQDQQFLETRVIFARLLRSMIALGKNFGFVLPGAVVATADLEFTFVDGTPRSADLPIPAGTLVTDPEGDVEFETVADATIPAGEIQVSGVGAENALAQSEVFVAPGSASYAFVLGSIPYVDGSTVVQVATASWSEANDLFEAGPNDAVYSVSKDDQGRATLTFGDGTNGAIPSGQGTVSYKTGGGSIGNVDANRLTVFVSGSRFPTLAGEQVALSVRNPSGAAGGVDAMGVEEARVAIPAFVRTAGKRSVTQQDFVDNALKVREVARAMLLTADNVETIPENSGILYVVPVGGGLPSSNLKTQVLNFILDEYPPPLTFQLSIENPTLKILSVSAGVYLARGIDHATARAAIEAALDSLFSLLLPSGAPNPQIDFGFNVRTQVMPPGSVQGILPWSTIFDAVARATTPGGTPVLREVAKNSLVPGADVTLSDVEFPTLGSVTLVDADTSTSF